MANSIKGNNWCWTLWKKGVTRDGVEWEISNEDWRDIPKSFKKYFRDRDVQFYVFQQEHGDPPEDEDEIENWVPVPHYQGFCRFTKRVPFNGCLRRLKFLIGGENANKVHISICRGSSKRNVDYCTKKANRYTTDVQRGGPFYSGKPPKDVKLTWQVVEDIKRTGSLPVPMHIRNAPTKLMKNLGYGKNYQYAHNDEDGIVDQEHLPDELKGTRYYEPTNRGYESIIKDRLIKWRQILARRYRKQEK